MLSTEPFGKILQEESGRKEEPNTEMRNPETGPADGISLTNEIRSVNTKSAGFDETETSSEAMCTVVAPGLNLGVAHFRVDPPVTVAVDRTLDPKKQYTS